MFTSRWQNVASLSTHASWDVDGDGGGIGFGGGEGGGRKSSTTGEGDGGAGFGGGEGEGGKSSTTGETDDDRAGFGSGETAQYSQVRGQVAMKCWVLHL